jgi:hypothetical protein
MSKVDGYDDAGSVVMTYIRAQIIRWVSDDFPGFVECQFADRFGREWAIIEKLPILSIADLSSHSRVPQHVLVACEVIAKHQDDAGREIVDITTMTPWGITTTDGTSSFQLYAEQLQVEPAVILK